MNILIITGGDSSERTISLNSAKNVKKTLINNEHKVKVYDLNNGYSPIIDLAKKYDILFPVLHGEEGEGGKLHKFLTKLDTPIVGSRNYKGLEKAWHKITFKSYCDKSKILTPKWKKVKNREDVESFEFPSVLKASNSGSSRGVMILNSKKETTKYSFKKIINLKTPLFVESYISGVEITAGILDNRPLPLIEIIPPVGQWFSYQNKYSPTTKEIPFAPSLGLAIQKEIQKIALNLHKSFNLGTYSRIDFMIENNKPYAIELNTIPGLTSESLMPKATKAAGINLNEFIEILIKNAK